MNRFLPAVRPVGMRAALLAVSGVLLFGGSSATAQPTGASSSPLPASVALATAPAESREVGLAVAGARAGDRVVLRGRIAMAKDAFEAGRSVFTLTDDAAAAGCCPRDGSLMDSCTLDSSKKATIRLVDSSGRPQPEGLAGRGGLRHGAEVFVVGTVHSAGGKDAPVIDATGIHVPAVGLPLGLIAAGAGEDGRDVSEVKKAGGLKKGDTVVIRGLIGGSKAPFVAGRAMFTVVGSALTPCNARPGDTCGTPWDYCCDPRTAITANSATVRVLDAQGNPLKTDLRGRAGIRELSEVIVTGTVAVSDATTLVLDASSLRVVAP